MAADDLSFSTPDEHDDPHARLIASRLRASYAAVPPHDPAQVARVARAVLANTMHAVPGPSVDRRGAGGLRPRWWWGAAAAALFMAVLTRPWRPEAAQRGADSTLAGGGTVAAGPAISGRTREERGGTVRFEFTLPSAARAVALVGDFNGWDTDATPMVRGDGAGRTWSARVPLEPGRHEYAFVVDGQRWVVDPLAPQVSDAGFGPTNAVVVDPGATP
jgi:hypothetical protein